MWWHGHGDIAWLTDLIYSTSYSCDISMRCSSRLVRRGVSKGVEDGPVHTPCHTGLCSSERRKIPYIIALLVFQKHRLMARGGHALPKVSPGPVMPNPSTPCGWVTGWPGRRAGGLRPSATLLDTPRRTPMFRRKPSTQQPGIYVLSGR
jgi:hypothetical protein